MSGHESSERTPADLAPPPRGPAPGANSNPEKVLDLIEAAIERGGPEAAYAVSGKLIRALREVIDLHEPYVPDGETTPHGVPDLRPICQACEGELWPCYELRCVIAELAS